MTLFLAVLVAVLLIALGVLYYFYLKSEREKAWLFEDKSMLEQEVEVLRKSNRVSLKVWQAERRRITARARDAEKNARDMQEFHLLHEYKLQHQLAGAHALIDLLMATFPKEYAITPVPFEVVRAFTPVIEMEQHHPAVRADHQHVF